ncbi:unnamed protein product [Caenorhabditis sp. 36 PRJEB53466]|nr:unnamed protein product [Caenorhabditis sp. 36 PRJEB53466]
MLLIDRRNRRSVQIFLLLTSFLLISGFFFSFFRYSEWQDPDFFPEEVHENQKTEREIAFEKVRKLQKGLAEEAADYGDRPKQENGAAGAAFKSASALFRRVNATALREAAFESGIGGKMTADSFYDEKLKQKQEEDRIAAGEGGGDVIGGHTEQEETGGEEAIEVIRKNETVSLDLVGKSAAVQTWLAKQEGVQKPLSAFESSLKVEEVEMKSKRRNPKFEPIDPEVEKRNNRVHQFKFVQ